MASQFTHSYIDVSNKITCRIETPHNKGTAVIVKPNVGDLLYVLTAKHCLLGKNFDQWIDISGIKISVPGDEEGEFHTFNLRETDEILLPVTNHLDAAVIVLKGYTHINVPQIELLNTQYLNRTCFFRGYPQAYGSLKAITIPSVSYVDYNVVTTTTPLSTTDSEPLYNCQGFSGSGVFCELNEQLFLTGLIYQLEEPFRRFPVCDLSFLSKLLSSHSLPEVRFGALPVHESISKDIEKLTDKTYLVLEGINDKLGDDFFLKRDGVDDDFERKFSNNRLIIFKGEAGTGKSAYVKSIILWLRDSNYSILAFKADLFARESIEDGFPYLDNNLNKIFLQLGQEQQTIILIDSLEKLLEVKTYEALKEFLRICKRFNNIKIIATCRSFAYQQLIFELHYDFPEYDFIEIPVLDDKELAKVAAHFPSVLR